MALSEGAVAKSLLVRLLDTSAFSPSINDVLRTNVIRNAELDGKLFDTILSEEHSRLKSKSLLQTIHVKEDLSVEQQNVLTKAFHEFRLSFDGASANPPHAFSKAHRTISYEYMKRLLSLDNKTCAQGYDVLIKDVGANPMYHLSKGNELVHSCNPNLSYDDSVRITNARYELQNPNTDLYNNNVAKIRRGLLNKDPKYICNNKAEDCNVMARYMMFVHSIYDISMENVAEAMFRATAKMAVGCFVYHSSVLTSDEGVIPYQDMHFKKRNRYGVPTIKFFFANDYGTTYEHRYDNYLRLLTSFTFAYTKHGLNIHYLYQLIEERCGVMFFKITRYNEPSIPKSLACRVLTLTTDSDNVVVYTWNFDTLRDVNGPIMRTQGLRRIKMTVPLFLVEQIKSYAYSLTDGRRTTLNLQIAANSFNHRTTISGKDIGILKPIKADDLFRLTFAIYIHVYITSWEQTQTLKAILKDEDVVRRYRDKNIFSRAVKNLSRKLCDKDIKDSITDQMPSIGEEQTKSVEFSDQKRDYSVIRRIISVFSDYIHRTTTLKRKYPITFTSVIQFLTVEEEIEVLMNSVLPEQSLTNVDQDLDDLIDKDDALAAIAAGLREADGNSSFSFSSGVETDCSCDNMILVPNSVTKDCVYVSMKDCGLTHESCNDIKTRLMESQKMKYIATSSALLSAIASDTGPSRDIFALIALEYDCSVCVHTKGKCHLIGSGPRYHFDLRNNHCQAYRTTTSLPPILCVDKFSNSKESTYDDQEHTKKISKLYGYMRAATLSMVVNDDEAVILDETESGLDFDQKIKYAISISFPQSVVKKGGYPCRSGMKTREILLRYSPSYNLTALSLGAPGGEILELCHYGFKTVCATSLRSAIPWNQEITQLPCFVKVYGPKGDGDITSEIYQDYMAYNYPKGFDFLGFDVMSDEPSDNDKLISSQVTLAIRLGHEGTLGYIKCNSYSKVVIIAYQQLCMHYSKVDLVRLYTTKPHCREFYFIFSSKLSTPSNICNLSNLYNFMHQLNTAIIKSTMILSRNFFSILAKETIPDVSITPMLPFRNQGFHVGSKNCERDEFKELSVSNIWRGDYYTFPTDLEPTESVCPTITTSSELVSRVKTYSDLPSSRTEQFFAKVSSGVVYHVDKKLTDYRFPAFVYGSVTDVDEKIKDLNLNVDYSKDLSIAYTNSKEYHVYVGKLTALRLPANDYVVDPNMVSNLSKIEEWFVNSGKNLYVCTPKDKSVVKPKRIEIVHDSIIKARGLIFNVCNATLLQREGLTTLLLNQTLGLKETIFSPLGFLVHHNGNTYVFLTPLRYDNQTSDQIFNCLFDYATKYTLPEVLNFPYLGCGGYGLSRAESMSVIEKFLGVINYTGKVYLYDPDTELNIPDHELKTSETIVEEISEIMPQIPTLKVDQNANIRVVEKDLFSVEKDRSLGHCVSRDLAMSKGIAVDFKKLFGDVDVLKAMDRKIGEVAYLNKNGRYIFYLITKQNCYDKPTYDTLELSLVYLRKLCTELKVSKLALPKIGCGLDKLEWNRVLKIIEKVFSETAIDIEICLLADDLDAKLIQGNPSLLARNVSEKTFVPVFVMTNDTDPRFDMYSERKLDINEISVIRGVYTFVYVRVRKFDDVSRLRLQLKDCVNENLHIVTDEKINDFSKLFGDGFTYGPLLMPTDNRYFFKAAFSTVLSVCENLVLLPRHLANRNFLNAIKIDDPAFAGKTMVTNRRSYFLLGKEPTYEDTEKLKNINFFMMATHSEKVMGFSSFCTGKIVFFSQDPCPFLCGLPTFDNTVVQSSKPKCSFCSNTSEYRCSGCNIIKYCTSCEKLNDHFSKCLRTHELCKKKINSRANFIIRDGNFTDLRSGKVLIVCTSATVPNPHPKKFNITPIVTETYSIVDYSDFVVLFVNCASIKQANYINYDYSKLNCLLNKFQDEDPLFGTSPLYLSRHINTFLDLSKLKLKKLKGCLVYDDIKAAKYFGNQMPKEFMKIPPSQIPAIHAAAKEYLLHCESVISASISACSSLKTMLDTYGDIKKFAATDSTRKKFWLVDSNGAVILGTGPIPNYMKVYTNGKLYDSKELSNLSRNSLLDKYIINGKSYHCALVTPETLLAFESEIIRNLSNVELMLDFEYVCIQAPPGCGKTTETVNVVDIDDMVCVCTTAGKQDVENRIAATSNLHSPVVTVASIVINDKKMFNVSTLYIDESRMSCPGMLIYAISRIRPLRVVFMGDGLQIPWVNSLSNFSLVHGDLYDLFPITKVWNLSHRITTTAACVLSDHYKLYAKSRGLDCNLMTTNSTNGEMSLVAMRNNNDVKFHPDAVYLVYLQDDKLELLKRFPQLQSYKIETVSDFFNLYSVHEFQGNQHPEIVVVRFNTNPSFAIFLKNEYAIVAISRHTKKFTYYTRVTSDALSALVNSPKLINGRVPNKDISKYYLETINGVDDVRMTEYVVRDPAEYRDFSFIPARLIHRDWFHLHSGTKLSAYGINVKNLSLSALTQSLIVDYDITTVVFDNDILAKYQATLLIHLLHKNFPNARIFSTEGEYKNFQPYQISNLMIMNGIFDMPVFERVDTIEKDRTSNITSPGLTINYYDAVYSDDDLIFLNPKHSDYKKIASLMRIPLDHLYAKGSTIHHDGRRFSFVEKFSVDILRKRSTTIPSWPDITIDEYTFLYNYCKTNGYQVNLSVLPDFKRTRGLGHETIQTLLNAYYGYLCMFDNSFDAYTVHTKDLTVDLGQTVVYNPMRAIFDNKPSNTLCPVLKTPAPKRRNRTNVETLLAFSKRNCVIPDMGGVMDYGSVSQMMFDSFLSACDKVEIDSRNNINACSYKISEWLKKQDFNIDQLVGDLPLELMDLTHYELGIKPDVKVVVDRNKVLEYSALQTIVYQKKCINAIFCSVWKDIRDLIYKLLSPRFAIFGDISVAEFSRKLTDANKTFGFFEKLNVEVDISKYDKSQEYLMVMFEKKLMQFLGVDPRIIKLWERAHLLSELRDSLTGLKARIFTQRKSGDASTFIGNTCYLIAVLLSVIPAENVSYAVFSGDDSVIWFKEEYYYDVDKFARVFNLEAKVYKYQFPYFCSKFLVAHKNSIHFVPDPIKFFVKLGRCDLVSYKHLEEYRRSCVDLLSMFADVEVCLMVSKAINERYQIHMDLMYILQNIPTLLSSENFYSFFYVPEGVVLDESREFNLD